MGRPRSTDVRKQINLPNELAERIRRYRFKHEFGTESEAVRVLLEKALTADETAVKSK